MRTQADIRKWMDEKDIQTLDFIQKRPLWQAWPQVVFDGIPQGIMSVQILQLSSAYIQVM